MIIKDLIKEFENKATSLGYQCRLCHREVFNGERFCEECRKGITENDESICVKCGRKTTVSVKRCFSCSYDWQVDKARSVYIYEGNVSLAIKKFKFRNERYLGDVFAEKLYETYLKNAFSADLITFVPVTRARKFFRSFNHSEYLARKLAELCGTECVGLLKKVKETDNQFRLKRDERQKNLKGSFEADKSLPIQGKKILVVDDVLTTGATSDEIARILKKGGAKSVYLLTVASTVLKQD
ncbi:MAG: ComF family protein [Christensenellaceae bacterium]